MAKKQLSGVDTPVKYRCTQRAVLCLLLEPVCRKNISIDTSQTHEPCPRAHVPVCLVDSPAEFQLHGSPAAQVSSRGSYRWVESTAARESQQRENRGGKETECLLRVLNLCEEGCERCVRVNTDTREGGREKDHCPWGLGERRCERGAAFKVGESLRGQGHSITNQSRARSNHLYDRGRIESTFHAGVHCCSK